MGLRTKAAGRVALTAALRCRCCSAESPRPSGTVRPAGRTWAATKSKARTPLPTQSRRPTSANWRSFGVGCRTRPPSALWNAPWQVSGNAHSRGRCPVPVDDVYEGRGAKRADRKRVFRTSIPAPTRVDRRVRDPAASSTAASPIGATVTRCASSSTVGTASTRSTRTQGR